MARLNTPRRPSTLQNGRRDEPERQLYAGPLRSPPQAVSTKVQAIRVLFVSHTAELVGPTNSLLLLLKELRDSLEVAVLVPGEGPFTQELEAEGITFVSLPSLTKSAYWPLVRLIRRERFELVYANNTQSCSLIAFLAARTCGRPFVCHVRGLGWGKSWRRLGYLRWADAVVAVSQACAGSVERFVAPGRLHVVYNGVPRDTGVLNTESERRNLRRELGLPPGATIILSVAHLCRRKDQELAVRAFEGVQSAHPAAHLCLVGRLDRDTRYVDHLRNLTRDLHLEDAVHFLGFRSDIPQLLQAADIFLHTAVADPHPRAVLEAMAAGLPVVATGVDGVAETVVDGETGWLVERRDVGALRAALLGLIASPERRSRMGKAGHDRVASRFSATATTRQVERVLRTIVGRIGSGSP